jgi:hypothetical protein
MLNFKKKLEGYKTPNGSFIYKAPWWINVGLWSADSVIYQEFRENSTILIHKSRFILEALKHRHLNSKNYEWLKFLGYAVPGKINLI